MTEQELLVLDMSKDEQDYWTVENTNRGIRGGNYESLADLAFRLRDEACSISCEKYYEALEAVYKHKIKDKQCCSFYAFQMYRIQPIDMIAAALKVIGKKQ